MTAAASQSLRTHLALAAGLSYGLSVFFWFAMGVFNLPGFILVSALAAAAGLAAGWFAGRRLWLTGLATILIRLALYALMMRSS